MSAMSATRSSISRTTTGNAPRRYAMTVFIAAMGCCCAHAATDTVTLLEEAQVRGPKVTLGEVAAIEGVNAEALSAIEVIAAPAPGSAKPVYASLVESRVRASGFDPRTVAIKGANRVLATTSYSPVSREAIAESLRRHILLEMPWDPRDTEVDVPPPLNDFIAPEGEVQIAWRASPQYRYVGAGAFTGEILVDGRVHRTLLCRATVEPYVTVATAMSDIPRGRTISPADIELRKVALSTAPQGAVTRIEDLTGMVATKTIFPGQILTTRMVDMPVLVRRRQTVPVELRSGAVHVRGQAIALTDARVGDIVACVNPNSREQFYGVVRPDGVVVVQ